MRAWPFRTVSESLKCLEGDVELKLGRSSGMEGGAFGPTSVGTSEEVVRGEKLLCFLSCLSFRSCN